MQCFRSSAVFCFILLRQFVLSLSSKPNCTAPYKEWSSWGSWSVCSNSCGTDGVRMRYQYCKLKNQTECIHAIDTEREDCNRYKCPSSSDDYYDMSERDLSLCLFYNPTNGGWSEWTTVSRCMISSCSGGIGFYVRYCNNPAPMNCGHHCKGNNTRTIKCSKFLPYEKNYTLPNMLDAATKIEMINPLSFMKDTKTIYISTNGLISVDRENIVYTNFNQSLVNGHTKPAVIPYGVDVDTNTHGGVIYYQQNVTDDISHQIDSYINVFLGKNNKPSNFQTKSTLMVTYDNVGIYSKPTSKINFQCTLTSDDVNTFGIFAYLRLDLQAEVIGFYDEDCGLKELIPSTYNTQRILKGSNIDIPGVYVFRLSCESNTK